MTYAIINKHVGARDRRINFYGSYTSKYYDKLVEFEKNCLCMVAFLAENDFIPVNEHLFYNKQN